MSTETTLEPVTETPELETMPRANVPAVWDEFKAQAEKLAEETKAIIVNETTLALCPAARAARLSLRQIRLHVEKKRKELGEEALRRKQSIDSAAKAVIDYIEPIEARLLEQEQFAERLESKRKAELFATRSSAVTAEGKIPSHYNLAEMSDSDFDSLISGFQAEKAAKIEADRKAAEEKAAREKAEAEAREKQRIEFERLKEENAKREAELKAEREKAAAERQEAERKAKEAAEIARKERAEIEAKAKALEAAERKRIESEAEKKKAEEAAAAKAKRAPDKTKLANFSGQVAALEIPTLDSPEGQAIRNEIEGMLGRLIEWVNKKAATL